MTRMSEIPPELAAEMTPAVRGFVESLLERMAQLEDRLKQTPQNSSLPPSSQHPHAKPAPKAKPSRRKPGGQPGHKKHERALVPPERVDETIVLKPDACRRCGRRLCGEDSQPLRHQVWELPEIRPIITEYQRHRLTCAGCGVATCAALPRGVPQHQSGPRLVAFVALLMAHFHQSKRRVSLFCETVLNIPCSAGLVVKLESQLEGRFRLTINRSKTRTVDLNQPSASIDFLGYTFRFDRDLFGRGGRYLNVFPSKRSLTRFRDRVRELTASRRGLVPVVDLVRDVSRYLRGWGHYFSYGYPRRMFNRADSFVLTRLARHLQRRSQRPFRPPDGRSFLAHLQSLGLQLLEPTLGQRRAHPSTGCP